jgi:hypothetical protein
MDFVDRLSKKYFQKLKAVQLEKVLQSKEVQQSKVMDSLEFGRVIHAEMSAISDAARP